MKVAEEIEAVAESAFRYMSLVALRLVLSVLVLGDVEANSVPYDFLSHSVTALFMIDFKAVLAVAVLQELVQLSANGEQTAKMHRGVEQHGVALSEVSILRYITRPVKLD